MPLHPIPDTATRIVTIPHGQCMVTVKANGGSVDIDVLHDEANDIWVPAIAASITADGAVTLFPGPYARLRMTPAGGATWTINGPGL